MEPGKFTTQLPRSGGLQRAHQVAWAAGWWELEQQMDVVGLALNQPVEHGGREDALAVPGHQHEMEDEPMDRTAGCLQLGQCRTPQADCAAVVRVFRYRLYPSRAQREALERTLLLLGELYNAALQERRDAWRKARVSLSAYQQQGELKDVRAARPDLAEIHAHLLQDAITRVDRAFKAFFRRVKAGEKPGFPRFKPASRYRTFTFKDAANRNGAQLICGGKKLRLTRVGDVKMKLHRPIEGTVKTISVTRTERGWYAAITCECVPDSRERPTGRAVGVDVGLTSFIATSVGETVENPRHLERALSELRRAQRRVARRKRGAMRRKKAVRELARKHERLADARRDFHHQLARKLVRDNDFIAVEDLSVKGLARSRLARQVHDAGWAQFLTILASKAESAGRELVKVSPSGTSQLCSACGALVAKTLSVRVHRCDCGYVADRDINAARNILLSALGSSARGGAAASRRSHDPRSPLLGAAW